MSLHALARRRLLAGAAVIAALAAALPSVSSAHRARAAGTPACSSSGTVNWIDTASNGAAGTIYYALQFTNLSGHACTLRGYPGVSAVNLRGHQIGKPAGHQPSPIKTITLGSGKTAKAALGIVDVGAIPVANCHAVTAAGLKVFAPNEGTARIVWFPAQVCSTSSSMTVRAVTH